MSFVNRHIATDTEDSSLLINLSAACCALGRNQEAITIGRRAIRVNSTDAKIWNRLGYIYCAMEKFDEAISFSQRLQNLRLRLPLIRNPWLSATASSNGLDESKRLLGGRAEAGRNQANFRLDIYEEAMSGNMEKSLKLLQNALEANQISVNDIRRDPNLNLLFDPSQIEAFAASLRP